ncbi:hypothetical protein [Reichenbachiella sp.]
MANWYKKGLIFEPGGNHFWNKSHAQVPTPVVLEDSIRVFYSTRGDNRVSRVSFFDVKKSDPSNLLYVHDSVVLDIGAPGTFDDCGTMPSWVVKRENELYMYYIGWNVRNTVPYYNSVGLAISTDNGLTFKKYSEGPLWDRNINEPYFSASTCVVYFNNSWHCYYLSCTEYREINSVMEPRYHLKYASSDDGILWRREGKIAIDYANDNEAGIVKASVYPDDNIMKMWYSYRSFGNYRTDRNNSYKIGYAESENGVDWVRKDDQAGILPSEKGWDSIMMAYPHVIRTGPKLLMFYNGNGFGESGIGYAEMTIDD